MPTLHLRFWELLRQKRRINWNLHCLWYGVFMCWRVRAGRAVHMCGWLHFTQRIVMEHLCGHVRNVLGVRLWAFVPWWQFECGRMLVQSRLCFDVDGVQQLFNYCGLVFSVSSGELVRWRRGSARGLRSCRILVSCGFDIGDSGNVFRRVLRCSWSGVLYGRELHVSGVLEGLHSGRWPHTVVDNWSKRAVRVRFMLRRTCNGGRGKIFRSPG
jgi:hypothetical protein